jgi:hypothetical protein
MNEFTKEELYVISNAMKHSVQRDIDEVHEQWASAYNKIRCMIETYCEHDYIPPKGSSIPHECGDCGKVFTNE